MPEEEKKVPVDSPVREAVNLAVRLMLFALVATLLLSTVNVLTKDKIAANTRKKIDEARQRVIGECDFADLDADISGYDLIAGVVEASQNGVVTGYVYELETRGYGGTIYLCVGIRSDGTVAGVEVSGHSETKGLSTPAEEGFLQQFIDRKAVSGNALKADAMTGATISSTAVRKAVDQAMTHFEANFGKEDAP